MIMMTTYFRPLKKEDIIEVLSLDLRQADRDEIKACIGTGSAEAIAWSLQNSVDAWVVIHKDKIEGVFGACLASFKGIPWFLATDKFSEFRITFMRQSLDFIMWLIDRYEHLENYIDSRNEKSIRWLKWLGFTVDEDIEYFMDDPNVPFYKFSMTKEVVM